MRWPAAGVVNAPEIPLICGVVRWRDLREPLK
jgi:hypothetical protein